MANNKHPFADLVARCLLAALTAATAASILLALAVLLLAGAYDGSSPPA